MKLAWIYIPRVTLALFVLDVLLVASVIATLLLLSPELSWVYSPSVALLDLIITVLAVTLIVLTANFAMGLYQRRFMRGRKLLVSTAICVLVVLVALVLIDDLFWGDLFPFWQIASAELLAFGFIMAARPIACGFFEHFVPKRRLALIASDEMADRVRYAIGSMIPADAELVGHFNRDASLGASDVNSTVETMVQTSKFDEVFVDMAPAELASLHLGTEHYKVTPMALFFDRYKRFTDIDLVDLSNTNALVVQGRPFFWAKRVIETFVALLIAGFFLPIMAFAMIGIKLEDGGALFYRQTRVGKNGKHFSVLKFRSMVENAEQNGAQWARVGDTRVTAVGAFLRKSRIDELPQLLSVIKGDMALVGPRPERPEFVADLARQIPNYEARHVVRPGLTGWAQISYPYGSSLEDVRWKTRFDLYYINNWSIWLDLAIIIQTVRVVLLAEGSR